MDIGIKENPSLSLEGFDDELKNKIRILSRKLMIISLSKIKIRDISSGISLLNDAINLDKTNYQAHNLLGLCYYKVGEISLAIRHWVISQNIKNGDNLAISYLEQIRENKVKLNDYNESFKKYNKSLQHAKAGSTDLSVVNLKKAISINPNFISAKILLAICYIKEGNINYALREFKAVLKIDMGNVVARKYISKFTSKDINKTSPIKETKSNKLPSSNYTRSRHLSSINKFVFTLFGIFIGTIIVYFALVPAIKRDLNDEIESKDKYISKLLDKSDKLNLELEQSKKDLDSLNIKLDEKSENALSQKSRLMETEKIVSVLRNYYIEPVDIAKAGGILVNVEEQYLNEDLKDFSTSMKKDILPILADRTYGKAYNAYLLGEFDKAIELFDLVYTFSKNPYPAENALYYKGRSYLKKGDTGKAADAFKSLINEYPDSVLVPDAKYFLEGQ